jgi:hypothetical protein
MNGHDFLFFSYKYKSENVESDSGTANPVTQKRILPGKPGDYLHSNSRLTAFTGHDIKLV